MHERTNIQLSAVDRCALEAVVANRNSPQKHVWRAKIVLLTAAGYGTVKIMRASGKAKTVIWRWQERFRDEGAAGLWRDKTRPSRIPPLSPEATERVVALTLAGPPPTASHWTGAAMAKATSISVSSVQRIWHAHGLRPHLVRRFKLSNDPQFAPKLKEIVGLYVNPPDHAIIPVICGSIAIRNRRCLRRHDVIGRGSPDGSDDDGAEGQTKLVGKKWTGESAKNIPRHKPTQSNDLKNRTSVNGQVNADVLELK
jgi:transposase